MSITNDPLDPRLEQYRGKGQDEQPVSQQQAYLALSPEELAKGFVKPLRDTYRHKTCGTTTRMPEATAKTYARDPWFYSATYCLECSMHRYLEEFTWLDGEEMSPRKWPAEEHARIAAINASKPTWGIT